MIKIDKKIYSNQGNQAVLDKIPPNTKLLLDVGCGDGTHAKILKGKGIVTDGITLSILEQTTAREHCRDVFIFNLEEGLPNIERSYDVVICSHVLEHICYPDKLLGDIVTVLKPGGLLIVALPNLMNYRSRWELVKGNFEYQESGIWDNSHFKWYTFKTGKKLLEKNGYNVIYADVDGDIPFLRLFRLIPKKVRVIIYKVLTFLSKGLFGGQLIYIGKKNENIIL